ncbi:MAG TPA: ABC transporter substrate-binding protein [Synergistaceae bacterium]|jgi:branched-chain amino acid transport system substrate-binding protein|nr:ABC transporter substrate-binding protein [Synergistaceae bacterium]
MRRLRMLAVLLVVALLSVGPAFAQETIKIGMLAPLTGFAAADGFSVYESVKIAVDKVNAEGGVLGKKVELVCYDDAADPKQSVPLAYKLIEQDKVVGFVAGSYSLPTRAVSAIFNDEEIPLVSAYALHPDITIGDYTFRNGFLGTVEGKGAAHVAVELLKAKKIALIVSDNDFGTTLSQGFDEYVKGVDGVQIVSTQRYPMSEKDFKPYLSKMQATNPDVLFFSGYYFQMGPALKQAREMGITIQFIGEEGADSPKTAEIAGSAAEGLIIVTNLNRDDERPFVQEFLATYRKLHSIEPDMVGASAYDGFMLIVDAIKKAGTTDGPAVAKALSETKNYDGLTGLIAGFDADGEVVKPIQIQTVKDGLFRYYGVITDPKLITPSK